jgi:hypothetical protein
MNTMALSEALSTAAQIAVALANSILPLALCVIGLLLLTVKPAPMDLALVSPENFRGSSPGSSYSW